MALATESIDIELFSSSERVSSSNSELEELSAHSYLLQKSLYSFIHSIGISFPAAINRLIADLSSFILCHIFLLINILLISLPSLNCSTQISVFFFPLIVLFLVLLSFKYISDYLKTTYDCSNVLNME